MKLGLVDVGGGLRGIYAAGVLDYCMDEHIVFDCCVGVSAGSANTTSYLAGQRGRNYKFYCEYAFRKEYMSLSNYLKHHSYIDMDYVYGTLSNSRGEYPLDYRARRYNEQVTAAKEWEKEGKVLIVSPDDTEGVSTLSKEREALDRLYRKGYRDGARIKAWLGLE